MVLGGVKEPARRDGVGAECVAAVGGHEGEIPSHDLRSGEIAAVGRGFERAIRCAPHIERTISNMEELSAHAGGQCGGRVGVVRDAGVGAICACDRGRFMVTSICPRGYGVWIEDGD
jgi:hypothetical protein